jgi:hypothetical protein
MHWLRCRPAAVAVAAVVTAMLVLVLVIAAVAALAALLRWWRWCVVKSVQMYTSCKNKLDFLYAVNKCTRL